MANTHFMLHSPSTNIKLKLSMAVHREVRCTQGGAKMSH